MDAMLLGFVLVIALCLIPFGLPGTWLMVASALGYMLLLPGQGVGLVTVVGTGILALAADVLEFTLASRFARRYGGSRRASWWAIIGGMIGALVGVPVPIVGPILGAFAGAFAGALAAELSRGSGGSTATRVATGALLGRVVAAVLKIVIGLFMAVWILVAAVR